MYPVDIVAKYVIMRCNLLAKNISNLKLQKILYFIQAEFLVVHGEVCFSEHIEAWDFGPVVPAVYHKYKVYGSGNIPWTATNATFPFRDDDVALIDGIIDECADYSASTLVEITHHQSPWVNAYRPYRNTVITPESIQRYFEEA